MPPETPQNGEYLVAAYAITVVILLGYWGTLWSKVKTRAGRKNVSGEEDRQPR
jgi:hypothetical protein